MITPGDRAPNFIVGDTGGRRRMFYAEASGRPIVLCIARSVQDARGEALLRSMEVVQGKLEEAGCDVFGLAADEPAVTEGRGATFRLFADARDSVVSNYLSGGASDPVQFRTLLLDGNQRVLAVIDAADPNDHGALALASLKLLPVIPPARVVRSSSPPVLMLPNVLNPDDCQKLIRLWHDGGHEEGSVAGRYGNAIAEDKKRSLDHIVTDPEMQRMLSETLARRIGPELQKTFCYFAPFFFDAHVILSYGADREEFFKPHRDNLTPGSQDRRFALSLNLNDGYGGGELWFPEYGPDLYKPEPGTACVFSCSLLHEALPVTAGRRWVLTTFFREPSRQSAPKQPQRAR